MSGEVLPPSARACGIPPAAEAMVSVRGRVRTSVRPSVRVLTSVRPWCFKS